MTLPAESWNSKEVPHDAIPELSLDQKVNLINERVEWLCQQLMMVMGIAQSNPMFRMAMNKAQKGNSNA